MRSGIAFSLRELGGVAHLNGDHEAAQAYYRQCITLANEINMPHTAKQAVWGLGNLALAKVDYVTARQLFKKSNLASRRLQSMSGGLGWVALGLHEVAEAQQFFQNDLQLMLSSGAKPIGLNALVGFAHIQAHNGEVSRALEWLALVKRESASDYAIKKQARLLWEELAAKLSSNLVAEAESRGQALDLHTTAVSLLEELKEMVV
jgi:tetratricopeptide (TPR) repeat protein